MRAPHDAHGQPPPRRSRPFAVLLAMAAACGPDLRPAAESDDIEGAARDYAETMCNGAASCGCVIPYPTTAECVSDHVARFEAAALVAGSLDEECLEDSLAPLREDACASTLQPATCAALRGRRGPGEPCDAHPELSHVAADECREGLACVGGECRSSFEDFPVLPPGSECWASSFVSCGSSFATDVFCAADGICREPQPQGAPCEPFGCESGLFCAGARPGSQGRCEPRIPLGAVCDPLDWDACEAPMSNGHVAGVTCDAATRTCVEGGVWLCEDLVYPMKWR